MYKALVRSHLDYCDIIYQPPLGMPINSLMEKVERIEYQAALAITGIWSGSSRSKIYEELGWESLSDRRTGRRVLQIHKIFNNKSPSYLKDKLPPNSRSLFSGIPRNTFREILCKSNRYMNSFSLTHLSGAGSSPAGSVGRDLNLQKLHYQYLSTSVAVVLVVRLALIANWFCSVFNVVCVVNVCPVHAADLN